MRESYSGQFGKAYRLKVLDTTSNNAMKRAIVLHSYNKESTIPICLSLGYPYFQQRFSMK
nr:murein L,D-transpeptidase catalytic domain family protein [Chryseobacterium sp.]